MLKGALQWSVYPQRTGSIYRRLWQPLQIGPCMLVLILPTPEGWKAEWTLAEKKVTQIFNPRPGRESNRGPQDWEAETLTTSPTPPLSFYSFFLFSLPFSFKFCRIWAERATFFFADISGRNFLSSFGHFWAELFSQVGGGGGGAHVHPVHPPLRTRLCVKSTADKVKQRWKMYETSATNGPQGTVSHKKQIRCGC